MSFLVDASVWVAISVFFGVFFLLNSEINKNRLRSQNPTEEKMNFTSIGLLDRGQFLLISLFKKKNKRKKNSDSNSNTCTNYK